MDCSSDSRATMSLKVYSIGILFFSRLRKRVSPVFLLFLRMSRWSRGRGHDAAPFLFDRGPAQREALE
jgi:hypothetical protein